MMSLISVKIAIFSVVYMLILQHEEPFNKWFKLGYRLFYNNANIIYKPLFKCEKCLAGQIALWYYLAQVFYYKVYQYNFFEHIYFIALTILITFFLAQFYKKVE